MRVPVQGERPRGWRGLHYRVYDWVLKWAEHPHAQWALFLLAFVEASCFIVPPDVLLIAMGLAAPRRSLRYALICTAGSVSGGLAGYGVGWGFWHVIESFCFEHLGFIGLTPDNFARVQQAYQDNAFLAVFAAGFTPIPYKVFTIAAGVFDIGIPVFLAASLLGRASRFVLVAALVGLMGERVKPFIDRYLGWLTLAFAALLILGFWFVGRARH